MQTNLSPKWNIPKGYLGSSQNQGTISEFKDALETTGTRIVDSHTIDRLCLFTHLCSFLSVRVPQKFDTNDKVLEITDVF